MTSTTSTSIDIADRLVGEVMRDGVVGCGPNTPLTEVARLMSEHRIHCVVVAGLGADGHGSRLVWGLVSDLDLVRAAATGEDLTAAQVAATEPVSASPADS